MRYGVTSHCGLMVQAITVHCSIDLRCLHGRVERFDVHPHQLELVLHERNLRL